MCPAFLDIKRLKPYKTMDKAIKQLAAMARRRELPMHFAEEEKHLAMLIALGADSQARAELITYNERSFGSPVQSDITFPMQDELFVETWQGYARDGESRGLVNVLQENIIQFGFPIQKGISQTPAYKAATLKGIPQEKWTKKNILFSSPEKMTLYIYPTMAGAIPVLFTRERSDFETLVKALAHRNEDVDVPGSMGACLVKGYNNWGRIYAYQRQWYHDNQGGCPEEEWPQEFLRLIDNKKLYQDIFLLLSDGYYSGINAAQMDMPEQEWRELSVRIRLEHEATHYFTQRVFGSAQNHVLDEIIADYMGIVAAQGHYRADWFLRFMGLEDYPRYRQGGRLQNYIAGNVMSLGAFKVLQSIVKNAAENLERFDSRIEHPIDKARVIMALSRLSLLDMADTGSLEKIIH
jgi:hypothetical protein